MVIIGLTGSISTGKTFLAKILEQKNFKVIYADILAKDLYKDKNIIESLKKIAPTSIINGEVDKIILANIIYSDPNKLKQLEALLHPFVRKKIKELVNNYRLSPAKAVIIEVPLLFEKNFYKFCDYTILVTSSKQKQIERLKLRPNFNLNNFNLIKKRQYSELKKLSYADYVIYSGLSKGYTRQQLYKILDEIGLL